MRQRFEAVHIPGVATRRFLDALLTQEWECLLTALRELRDGQREFAPDPNFSPGGYLLEACGFMVWFTAPVPGEIATVTQVRYRPAGLA